MRRQPVAQPPRLSLSTTTCKSSALAPALPSRSQARRRAVAVRRSGAGRRWVVPAAARMRAQDERCAARAPRISTAPSNSSGSGSRSGVALRHLIDLPGRPVRRRGAPGHGRRPSSARSRTPLLRERAALEPALCALSRRCTRGLGAPEAGPCTAVRTMRCSPPGPSARARTALGVSAASSRGGGYGSARRASPRSERAAQSAHALKSWSGPAPVSSTRVDARALAWDAKACIRIVDPDCSLRTPSRCRVRSNVLIPLIFLLGSGCSARAAAVPSEAGTPDTGPNYDPNLVTVPFLVDDHFIPSGCMGDCTTNVSLSSSVCPDRGLAGRQEQLPSLRVPKSRRRARVAERAQLSRRCSGRRWNQNTGLTSRASRSSPARPRCASTPGPTSRRRGLTTIHAGRRHEPEQTPAKPAPPAWRAAPVNSARATRVAPRRNRHDTHIEFTSKPK